MCFRSLKEKKDKNKSAKSTKTSAEDDHEKKLNANSKSGNKKDPNKDDTKKDRAEKEEKKHFKITVPNHGGEIPDNDPPTYYGGIGSDKNNNNLSSEERKKLQTELDELERKENERDQRLLKMSEDERMKFYEDDHENDVKRSNRLMEILNKLHPPPSFKPPKLSSGERKKLENDLDETQKKISEVFQKLRKKKSSDQTKHNEDDVSELRKQKMKERELIGKLIPEYNGYGR